MKTQSSRQPSLSWILHTQYCQRLFVQDWQNFLILPIYLIFPLTMQRSPSGFSNFLLACYTVRKSNMASSHRDSHVPRRKCLQYNVAWSKSTISIFINLRERRRNKSCWNVKIIREEAFPGNKHGPHYMEGRTNKLWGGCGPVKSLFTPEERNKVGRKPLGLHSNKSSSRGWGRRGWVQW